MKIVLKVEAKNVKGNDQLARCCGDIPHDISWCPGGHIFIP